MRSITEFIVSIIARNIKISVLRGIPGRRQPKTISRKRQNDFFYVAGSLLETYLRQ